MAYRRTAQVQARLDATRNRIIDAAVRLVATGGWTAASVAAVAHEAGVATGTVYRHLTDKDDLLAAAFRRAASHELTVVTEAAGTTDPLHPAAADSPDAISSIEVALRTFAGRALRGRRLAYALLAEPAGPAVEAERLAYRTGYRALFRDLLDRGVATGELDHHDTEVVAAALVGAMGEALVGPLAPVDDHAAPGTDAKVDALVAACLRAVPVRSPAATATPTTTTATRATTATAATTAPRRTP